MVDDFKQFFLRATIDRLEGKYAVLRTDDGQEILWPSANLPKDVKEGSIVHLYLRTSKDDEEERAKLAKSLLEEILKPDQS